MGLYAKFIRRFAGSRWFAAIAARVAPALDLIVHRLSRGRRLATPNALPTLMLTATGRRSGDPRTVALSFVELDGAPVVVGTNWGRPAHPSWSANLLAEPRARVEYRGDAWDVVARPLEPGQRARAWDLLDEMLPAYRAYRERLDRPVRMFRLERV